MSSSSVSSFAILSPFFGEPSSSFFRLMGVEKAPPPPPPPPLFSSFVCLGVLRCGIGRVGGGGGACYGGGVLREDVAAKRVAKQLRGGAAGQSVVHPLPLRNGGSFARIVSTHLGIVCEKSRRVLGVPAAAPASPCCVTAVGGGAAPGEPCPPACQVTALRA